MLTGFGAQVTVEDAPEGRIISIRGEAELKPQAIIVPGDPSSAAFPMEAAQIVPGSDLLIENVGVPPTRAGLIKAPRMLGSSTDLRNERGGGGKPVAALPVRAP